MSREYFPQVKFDGVGKQAVISQIVETDSGTEEKQINVDLHVLPQLIWDLEVLVCGKDGERTNFNAEARRREGR